jgi:hypothetical protein
MKGWRPWKWYGTEKKRDQALADLERHLCNVWKDRPPEHRPQYRKAERMAR